MFDCVSASVGGDATWIIVQRVKTSLSSLSSPHSESQKDVDHFRCDIGLVSRNAPPSDLDTDVSVPLSMGRTGKDFLCKESPGNPILQWSPQALFSCFPLGNFYWL